MDMLELHSHESWMWYGYAGHLIVASRCAYHLCTRVGDKLVSTVGGLLPRHDSTAMERIGAGENDYFETYVFNLTGEDGGDPIIDYSEIDGRRYADSRSAEIGHYEFCWKYQRNREAAPC